MKAVAWSAALLVLAGPACAAAQAPAPVPAPARAQVLRLGVAIPRMGEDRRICPSPACSLARGVELGIAEAERVMTLTRRRLEVLPAASELPAADALRRLMESGADAVVGAAGTADCVAMAAAAEQLGRPFVNVGCRDDALQRACRRWTWHVEAGEADYRSARGRAGPVAVDAVDVALWHASLQRFGAGELNQRFRERFGAPMDAQAWAGWMGVKVVVEAWLRRNAVAAGLETGPFDGHKGAALAFDRASRSLRQPLYVVARDGAVTEVPPESEAERTADACARDGAPESR